MQASLTIATGEVVGGTDKLLADLCKVAVRDLRHAPVGSQDFATAAQFLFNAGLLDEVARRHNLPYARCCDARKACRTEEQAA